MNVELLRKIAAVIQEKPRQFSISSWHKSKTEGPTGLLCSIPESKRESCGTTHCIAGWAQVLSPSRNVDEYARVDAMRLLDLDRVSANRLFLAELWPRGFGGWRASAKQAAARIEHFIETGGRE